MTSSTRSMPMLFQPRFLILVLLAFAVAVGLVQKSLPVHASTTAAFTTGNLVIYRVGDGSAALASSATAVFLDEYSTAGAFAQSIPLPTTVSGAQKRLTASGTSTSEGLLTLSTDGQYLTAAGYDAALGTASITGSLSSTVNRVIGRIDSGGTVDTSTALTDGISQGNPRGAVSTNGTDLWLSGTSAGGGIRYATFGATTSTSLTATPTNIRATNIFGGQLYISAASGAFRLATVGSGTPTTSGQTTTNLPGFPTSGGSPYAFFFADLDAGVAGVDTVYVADDSNTTGGIFKYSLVGGSWTARGSIVSDSVRGITGVVNTPSSVTLYITSANSTTGVSRLSTLTDTAGYNTTITGSVSTLATAATNTAFRGVAFVPGGPPPSPTPTPTPTPTPSPTPTPTPTLSVNDVAQAETNSLTTTFTFTVSLTSPATSDVFFDIATSDGTAQDDNPAVSEDNDYVAKSETGRSITTGNSSTTFTVTVNGDATTEPNETFFVTVTNVTGGAIAGDLQGQGTIQNDDVTAIPIHDIQGAGVTSPYNGTTNVTTTGIVTARKTNGFIIQDPSPDANTDTSEAIFVFTSSAPSASIQVGDSLQVTGTVAEFLVSGSEEPVTPADPRTATELISPSIVTISSGNSVPAALDADTLNIFDPAATSRTNQLEKYEFMRISVPSITVSEPTNGFGEFWAVETGVARPFREPGIERGDPIPTADQGPYAGLPPPNVPIFDGNFERIQVDSDDATSTANVRRSPVNVSTGAVVTEIVGPLDYAFINGTGHYRIMLDFAAVAGITPGVTAATAAPTPTATEFTIAHANLENFTSDAGRLNKASLAIRNVMRNPDILGIIEVNSTATATALANKVNTDAASASVNYVAYFSETGGTQDIGYLVNTARVTVVGTPAAYNSAATFTYCGVNNLLHDRPSFVLTATVPQSGGGTIPVTVILNHTKSLIATDSPVSYGSCGTGTEGARNREKRRLQAEDIADLIQLHINENLVVLGDLNAFDFNDGLGDIVGTFRGTPAPADQVIEPSTDRWPYQLTNLLYTVAAAEQYSLLFEGNAQALDHVLVNNGMLSRNTRFAFGRYNSDFDVSFAADTNRPEALSDHDAPVAYFGSTPTAADATVSGTITDGNGTPLAGAVVNLNGSQTRKTITNANGYYQFDNVETTGFYTVTPSRANYSFGPANRSFSQLGNKTDATFTANANGDHANPLDTPEYFVRQQYLDVLGREPDEGGFNYWSDEILHCGADSTCVDSRRRDVAASFFMAREFQDTGSYIYDMYKGSLGRRPVFSEYVFDRQQVIGGSTLAAQKAEFAEGFVGRAEFVQKYQGNTTAESFVDALLQNVQQSSQVDLSSRRNALLTQYHAGASLNQSRSLVMRALADDAALKEAEYNAAFVLTEYFGYLRRDPEPEGYAFWLNVLNHSDVGNYRGMVCSFITSTEYQQRFSSVVSHSNAECGR